MRNIFKTFDEVVTFAVQNGVPYSRSVELSRMNARQLLGLRIRSEFIIGISMLKRGLSSGNWLPSDVECCSIDDLTNIVADIEAKGGVVQGYYCVQHTLDDKSKVISLDPLKWCSLDQQLKELTGDGFGYSGFYSDGFQNSLKPSGILVHKETECRFLVPNN